MLAPMRVVSLIRLIFCPVCIGAANIALIAVAEILAFPDFEWIRKQLYNLHFRVACEVVAKKKFRQLSVASGTGNNLRKLFLVLFEEFELKYETERSKPSDGSDQAAN
uniref:Uncharacterized protein n=1 Tax=Anopheles culicifacies TaxID=139723 RepID=A0A182LRK6_9DIPT